jgi:hypothetical protein
MGPQVGQEYILGLFINTHEYLYVSTWRLRGACVVWKCVAVPQPKRRILACKQIDRAFLRLLRVPSKRATRDYNSIDGNVKPNQTPHHR